MSPARNWDRSLTNGRWSPPERRNPNEPVTGQHAAWHPAQRVEVSASPPQVRK